MKFELFKGWKKQVNNSATQEMRQSLVKMALHFYQWGGVSYDVYRNRIDFIEKLSDQELKSFYSRVKKVSQGS